MTLPKPPAPMLLIPSLQRYAWGDPRFIPELLGYEATDQPCAEAWFGAHPLAPSTVREGGEARSLERIVAERADEILGERTKEHFGALPYLMKVLAAATPLSIQVHPNRDQAEAGYARQQAEGIAPDAPERSYRDRNHKPELLVALTPFDALCGFRRPHEITSVLESLPEVAALLPPFQPTPEGLRTLLEAYFALPEDQLRAALTQVLERLAAQHQEQPFNPSEPAYWALCSHETLSGKGEPDRGLLFVFLLALMHLEPGQGIFLPSGFPHAYLQGAAVEIMASSDNVLRAGLTPKPIDPQELLRIVSFNAGPPPIVEPFDDETGLEGAYPAAAAEFDLYRLRLKVGDKVIRTTLGPEILLPLPSSTDDTVTFTSEHGSLTLRRGQACLVPHGTRYSVEASGDAQVFRASEPTGEPAEKFRDHRPTRLAFGTSGLRGLICDITDLEAYINTRGFLDYLIAIGDAGPGTPVAVAGDLRPSTDSPDRSILRAVARAVRDTGMHVVNCGRIPTPALTYFGLQKRWPSIMVTGSHIPFDRNGIKFNKSTGEVLKSDEPGILVSVERIRRLEYVRAADGSRFDDDGSFRNGCSYTLPPVTNEARDMYVRRYLDAFPDGALSGMRIALYEHSAVGRAIVADILRGLGAEVHLVGRSDTFVAIDTEAISDARLAELQRLADEVHEEFGPVDALVSTDGDSDRPMVLGFDEQGRVRFFGGDVLGLLVADYLRADAVAVPISSNDVIDLHLGKRGVDVVRTRIGSPWVIAAMAKLEGERRVGWEANGGFLTGSVLSTHHGKLEPLPTRDAVLPIVAVLHAARLRKEPLVALLDALPERYSKSGLLDEVPSPISRALIKRFGPANPSVRRAVFAGNTVSWIDTEGKEHEAEGELRNRLRWVGKRIGATLSAERGFGPLESIDYLDGIRMRFEGGDIAHVRPSGNAPQLRIYAVANSQARAREIVSTGVAEPNGILRSLCKETKAARFVDAIRRNIETTDVLFAEGEPAEVIGTVSGSEPARAFWQRQLDVVRPSFRAREAISFHEDLPVNQAFGLLLLWQRLRDHLRVGEGALVAFVFGEGTRAAPLTEAESGQKPAISSFVVTGNGERRSLSIVELALRYFAPVENYLRRSGFQGIVVKWGDEVQIPTLDLTGHNDLFKRADVVRFVSMRAITPDEAANKDWVGVDSQGRVTAFIPRRPIDEMEALADRGLIQRREHELFGGINLGSIALSRALLDLLLDEFSQEVNDPDADRKKRPDLDPQLFTALTIAAMDEPGEREASWKQALAESASMRKLDANLPGIVDRLRRALERFEQRHGRPVRMVAMDFGDQYWGDIGQHRQMARFFTALRDSGPAGDIARALASLNIEPDAQGNRIAGDTRLGPNVQVRDSVLIDAHISEGEVTDSVLVGTRCDKLQAQGAFDVHSTVREMRLEAGAGSYKLVSTEAVTVGAGERLTTVFLPDQELLMRVHEETDLRDKASTYDVPILDNELSFRETHALVSTSDPALIEARRAQRRQQVLGAIPRLDSIPPPPKRA